MATRILLVAMILMGLIFGVLWAGGRGNEAGKGASHSASISSPQTIPAQIDTATIPAPAIAVAEAFVKALNQGDGPGVFTILTGFEDAAEKMRLASTSTTPFLTRQDLRAVQRLQILGLRALYTAEELARLSAADIMLTPLARDAKDGLALLPVPDSPLQLAWIRQDDGGSPEQLAMLVIQAGAGTSALYAQTFALIPAPAGWRIRGDFLFDGARFGPQDMAILTQVRDKGGGPEGWLETYAAITDTQINPALLAPPQ